ncbi:hypothetical protein [Sporosarcina sp. PTS2304]|uniref:hypothetical protein n=1 Tax=Sporosarcina sp. PTS2304 TaxID=2283194 RepID=UPI0013B38BE6|nr:hypothetical protein [Sporosarcina sp. PTS2304]
MIIEHPTPIMETTHALIEHPTPIIETTHALIEHPTLIMETTHALIELLQNKKTSQTSSFSTR